MFTEGGDVINKKILIAVAVLIIAFMAIMVPINSAQDFDGLFEMDVPFAQHYRDVSWCLPNGALGCAKEYWEDNSGCAIDGDEMVVYYYNNSWLVDGESNAFEHAIRDLTTSYLYKVCRNDGNTIMLTNDIGMKNVPPYLVGKANEDGSEVVFVGGHNLDDLEKYANSIKFK